MRRERLALGAAAVAAPVLWMALDLVSTGDPLHSLHGTQELAEQLARPRELDTALQAAPAYLRFALTGPLLWLGLAGFAAALITRYERTLLPAAVAGLGLLAFLVLGVSGLPLLSRYLLLPATLLTLWAAFAALGFTVEDARGRRWLVAGALALALVVVSVPGSVRGVRSARALVQARATFEQDLTAILTSPPVRTALARCPLAVPDDRPRPLARYLVRTGVTVQAERRVARATTLGYATEAARATHRIGPAPPAGPPSGGVRLAGNATWIATSGGGASPCGG